MSYKAGDFTNGKMSEIFKNSFENPSTKITHKQLGDFHLVSDKAMKVLNETIERYVNKCVRVDGKLIPSITPNHINRDELFKDEIYDADYVRSLSDQLNYISDFTLSCAYAYASKSQCDSPITEALTGVTYQKELDSCILGNLTLGGFRKEHPSLVCDESNISKSDDRYNSFAGFVYSMAVITFDRTFEVTQREAPKGKFFQRTDYFIEDALLTANEFIDHVNFDFKESEFKSFLIEMLSKDCDHLFFYDCDGNISTY